MMMLFYTDIDISFSVEIM